MRDGESDLEMVTRHVRQGAAHVSRQREIVAELRAHGHASAVAERLLAAFEDTQRQHLAHLARIGGR